MARDCRGKVTAAISRLNTLVSLITLAIITHLSFIQLPAVLGGRNVPAVLLVAYRASNSPIVLHIFIYTPLFQYSSKHKICCLLTLLYFCTNACDF